MEAPRNLVTVENIRKSFNRNTVLKGISLELNESEVITIIGGNGAGKSTLMKILTGIYKADEGFIEIYGEKVEHLNPFAAHERGIYLVPQEPLLFPNMTVEQNLTIGFRKHKNAVREESMRLIKELGWNIDLKRLAATLSIAEQQQLEIIKGLVRKAKVLILDEPTSTLTFSETESLFKVIKQLRNSGVGIFYITHRLDEVFQISTHAVILRDGKVTLKGRIDEFTKEMLIQGLLPEGNENLYEDQFERRKTNHEGEEPILKVVDIVGEGFRNISFDVYKGEVVGLAGLVGAGRTEIAEAIYGINPIQSGKVYLDGKDITRMSINETVDSGLAYIPEDRFLNGIFSISSVRNNITSQIMKKHGIFTKKKVEEQVASRYIDRLRIKVSSQEDDMKSLSGGNQQKVVIARALSMNPKLIIMDEPTRGIDAAARGDIYSIISELKNQGFSILLISSDLEEIGRISDRIYAVYQGTCTVCLSLDEINAVNVMKAAFGTFEGSDQGHG
ncbi:sugar ABC transporter ATP-binding protein [Neobacillus sp. MM2021_6]|uniref:sugar ABC transporter ATP-binding protein n=1 Tax=Bacillaceae TaxID=186817 RepID=UPI00140C6BDF|nr:MULTISPECIES: sugar ABC transporter ATP-binding protein [Bacillaceae]MBO0962275.1 sugar ABC transporter ATP-binding protein [Neobacillus sp. MM2021_6]NHC19424.1 sugar ABC transporter ATP-binding protein [Bacillus sp. MM2020_4]